MYGSSACKVPVDTLRAEKKTWHLANIDIENLQHNALHFMPLLRHSAWRKNSEKWKPERIDVNDNQNIAVCRAQPGEETCLAFEGFIYPSLSPRSLSAAQYDPALPIRMDTRSHIFRHWNRCKGGPPEEFLEPSGPLLCQHWMLKHLSLL